MKEIEKDLKKLDQLMRLMKVIIWFSNIFSTKKRVVSVTDTDGVQWHYAQVKRFLSSWKNVNPTKWDMTGEYVIEWGVELSSYDALGNINFDKAVACIKQFEKQKLAPKINKKSKPKYTYL